MTVQEILTWGKSQQKSVEVSHLRALLGHIMGFPASFLFSHPDHPISLEVENIFKNKVQRLCEGVPLSRVVGEREFWSLSFTLNEATLDPRADSECLIEGVLNHYRDLRTPLQILDMGTGTGCLLISLLSEYREAQGLGVDKSPRALEAARQNAQRILRGSHRAVFCLSNWYEHVVGGFDVIISNPPYLTLQEYETLNPFVKCYDPKEALVGGEDGLEAYRFLIQGAPAFLKQKGILVLEIGHLQKTAVTNLLHTHGFCLEEIRKDLSGIERCLVSSYHGSKSEERVP